MESFFLIEVWLIYNVVLVSGVQKRDTFFLRFFSIIVYCKILNSFLCYTVGLCCLFIFVYLIYRESVSCSIVSDCL